MLVAYALENLFKVILIWKHQDAFRSEVLSKVGNLPKKIKSHDLIYLAKETYFKFDTADEDLLFRLYRNSDSRYINGGLLVGRTGLEPVTP